MTIVEYFDPRNGEHLRAWRELERLHDGRGIRDFGSKAFCRFLGLSRHAPHALDWPDDWGQLIIAKMADAWMEEYLPPPYVEVREKVRRVKLVDWPTPEPGEDADAADGSLKLDKRVSGYLRVPRLRRGGGETPT